ncbi:MAG: sigma-70 family RNA polymerase sigma factor [Balneolaceae bacterium]
MNYAPLVKAIQEGDQETANRMIAEATPILIRMLRVRMNASREDAEDAVQKMFLYIIEAIQENRIENPSGLLSYMIMSCRHNYLKEVESDPPGYLDDQVNDLSCSPDQLSNLLNEEIQRIHIECIDKLKKPYRSFYIYCLTHEEAEASEIAKVFGISVNNVWTRKHRIFKKVRECVRKKIEE